MNVRIFLIISAVIAFIFGLGFLLMPGPLTAIYNIRLDAAGQYVGQLFGAAILSLGIINFSLRNSRDLNGILLGNFVGGVLAFFVSFVGMLNGTGGVNALGWLTVVIYLFLAVGFGYYRFVAHGMLRRVTR